MKFHMKVSHGSQEWKNVGYNVGKSQSWINCAKHVDDNKDTIEDDVRETNVRTFVGVTDIAKIVRKNSVFGFYR